MFTVIFPVCIKQHMVTSITSTLGMYCHGHFIIYPVFNYGQKKNIWCHCFLFIVIFQSVKKEKKKRNCS